jgi:hypothetical protein
MFHYFPIVPPVFPQHTRLLQEGIRLSEAQQLAFVGARRTLLTRLTTIRQQREKVIFALGLAMLQATPVRTSFSDEEAYIIGCPLQFAVR